ncbi:siderophore-interacting protein [Gordonia shandongensis]|uniref:siderophore-interacting protein n=1 Tax=Gordonia shandongensis TaxID=376351 RepID=UPI0003FAD4AD|nr:siderophore-interacting protein [Gordonia shandongensis]
MNQTRLGPHEHEINLVMHDLRPRWIDVVSVQDIAPRMKRVLFAVEDPAGFHFHAMAPDQHVKLFFPARDGSIVMPEVGPRGMVPPEDGPRPIHRDYTVRAFDAAAGTVTVDFVLHTHGVGGTWAEKAGPGDRLGLLGPRGSHFYPVGYDWYLLAADETALPALARWLEELPADKPVLAFAEVSGEDAEVALPERPGLRLRYLHRGDAAPGDSDVLDVAIRGQDLPEGRVFAWMAGEADSLKSPRRYLRRELGLPKEQVKVDGYWRRGTVNLDHHDPGDD